jgi:hypothetical protein
LGSIPGKKLFASGGAALPSERKLLFGEAIPMNFAPGTSRRQEKLGKVGLRQLRAS